MRSLFTIHAGEFLVGSEVEQRLPDVAFSGEGGRRVDQSRRPAARRPARSRHDPPEIAERIPDAAERVAPDEQRIIHACQGRGRYP